MLKYNFSGFIWGSSINHQNEILEHINNAFPVLHYYNYEFSSKKLFEKSVLDIYTTDDIDPKKVKNVKITSLLKFPLQYTYFKFYIETPNFRKKKATNNNISKVVEQIKKSIRSKYKSKIKNYIHDNIIHISDNYEQTVDIEKIMQKYQTNRIYEFINLKYFLKCNYKNNIFDRADMLVRKYSIEQYLKNPDYDFSLYKKMQEKRTRQNPKDNASTFKKLIISLTKNEFNNNYPIRYSYNYLLRDGSHRLSYCYLKQKTFICIKSMEWDKHSTYSIDWFKKSKFSEKELNIINNELNKLLIFISS